MKQDRARRTHEVLLDSAAAEFVLHGFAGTNLSDVAARSRVTKGALYGHFASKAELAEELTRGFEEEWAKFLASAGSSLCSLRELTVGLARRMDEDVRFPAGLRLTMDAARASRREPVPLGELRVKLVELVRDAQREGQIDAGHRPEVLARVVVALLMGAHSTRWTAEGESGEEVGELWDVVLSAFDADA
ncbi:TetR family transcriptional regulator [Streptomyces sp. NPDC017958]|uniref:TetR family transcriptional regulator n=1 Tax=Streptomyces sp. NPDC017958 TaxID=3365021 RepID=UPI0037BE02BB